MSYLPSTSKVQEVYKLIQNSAANLATLKDNLAMAPNRMKQQADQHRSERNFEVGE